MINRTVDAIIMRLLCWRHRRYQKAAWNREHAAMSFTSWTRTWIDGYDHGEYDYDWMVITRDGVHSEMPEM
jgi:hypothetical protein